MDPSPDRRGFKLSELAVVCAIGLVLLGLFWPATRHVRETAARTQCINNFKQIGLSVHNYAGAYQGALPPLTCDLARPTSGAWNAGILFTIIPYLESEQMSGNAMNTLPNCIWYAPIVPSTVPPFSTTPPGTTSSPICSQPLKVYQCPADSTIINGMSANQDGSRVSSRFYFPWAASSYAANYQVFGTENDFGSPKSGNYCGPKYKIGEIPDGTSSTVFFGEQFAACGSTAGTLWAYPGIGNYSGTQYTSFAPGCHAPVGEDDSIVNTSVATNSKLWAPVFANSNLKYGFTTGGFAGSIYEFNFHKPASGPISPPYAANAYWDAPPQFGVSRDHCDKSRLQSFHTAAVIVGLGDGSARVIKNSVSQETWYSAIMPADGVILGTDW
jgi:hypothetical protein